MQLYDLALNSKLFKLTANYSIYCCCDDQVIWRILYGSFFLVKKKKIQLWLFSCSVMSNSLQPYGLQHTRLPCPSLSPGVAQTYVHRVSDAIQPSHPLSSPSTPAFNLSQHQSLSQ